MEFIRTHPEPSFNYFYIGFVLSVLGIWISTMYLAIGLLIILTGIFVLLSVKGVLINPNTKQVKAYFNFMFLKIGNWIPLSEFTHVVLGPNSSSQTLSKFSSTVRTKSYSVYLLNKNHSKLELKEFIEYNSAEVYLYEIAIQTGLPTANTEELIKQVAAEKRPHRKR